MNRKVFLSCLLLLLPFCVLAAEHPVTESELAANKELSQTRADAQKESLNKDIQAQAVHIEAQDKRFEQQDKLLDSFSTRISDLSFTLIVAGFILTLVGLVASLAGYFTVSRRAKDEASLAVKKWLDEEGPKAIKIKITDMDSYIAEQIDKIAAKREEFDREIEKLRVAAAAPLAELQKKITAHNDLVQEQTLPSNSDVINQLVDALKHKPEATYGFEDWNARAHDAYTKGNFALAAEYWLQAARGGKGSGVQVAQSLYNAGIALGQLKRTDEAIAVFDEVVSRYGSAPEATLRLLVANALLNKSMTLGLLKKLEETILVCDEVVSRYGSAPEGGLRELVADAFNVKGFALLCRAKANWGDELIRLADLQAAAILFSQSEKEISNKPSSKPIVWGNQAYAAFLLGQMQAARPLLNQALQQGGEKFYKDTLGDLDIYPVPPDAAFRALLDEVWAEVKQNLT
jgi:tetratricopeptide (TPR) repeat protein